ncbi:MAG: hypothetical protein WBH90_17345 [Aggregatilineales bacterium]|nr:hypothetical protein [Chloroflexota bacterium]HOA23926.1 hypothetical protein [Aggregatilineales bacterium]HQE19592.1 hypothetical protein [Aggregatilineales bacterium]
MMLNPITSHELARVRQREIREWVRQQHLLASVQGEKPYRAAGLRDRAGGVLRALQAWLRPRRRGRGGEALSRSNY